LHSKEIGQFVYTAVVANCTNLMYGKTSTTTATVAATAGTSVGGAGGGATGGAATVVKKKSVLSLERSSRCERIITAGLQLFEFVVPGNSSNKKKKGKGEELENEGDRRTRQRNTEKTVWSSCCQLYLQSTTRPSLRDCLLDRMCFMIELDNNRSGEEETEKKEEKVNGCVVVDSVLEFAINNICHLVAVNDTKQEGAQKGENTLSLLLQLCSALLSSSWAVLQQQQQRQQVLHQEWRTNLLHFDRLLFLLCLYPATQQEVVVKMLPLLESLQQLNNQDQQLSTVLLVKAVLENTNNNNKDEGEEAEEPFTLLKVCQSCLTVLERRTKETAEVATDEKKEEEKGEGEAEKEKEEGEGRFGDPVLVLLLVQLAEHTSSSLFSSSSSSSSSSSFSVSYMSFLANVYCASYVFSSSSSSATARLQLLYTTLDTHIHLAATSLLSASSSVSMNDIVNQNTAASGTNSSIHSRSSNGLTSTMELLLCALGCVNPGCYAKVANHYINDQGNDDRRCPTLADGDDDG
jgi:hypothetical protein